MVKSAKKRVTLSATSESRTQQTLCEEEQVEVIRLSPEEEANAKLYVNFEFDAALSKELYLVLETRNKEKLLNWFRTTLSLQPEQSSILTAPFDPSQQEPTKPDYIKEDGQSRDAIWTNFITDSTISAYKMNLDCLQISAWTSIFLRTHKEYINACTTNANATKCMSIFKKYLYDICYYRAPELERNRLFQVHQLKQLSDLFLNSYIKNLKLITFVFTHHQERVLSKLSLKLISIPEITPLNHGVHEDLWEEFLEKERKDTEEAIRARLEAETKANESVSEVERVEPVILPPCK